MRGELVGRQSTLWRRRPAVREEPKPPEGALFAARRRALPEALRAEGRATHRLAFFGLCLFTVLLYARPNDLLPADLGTLELVLWSPVGLFPFLHPAGLPIVKTVAIVTLVAYVATKLAKGERLTDWPIEMRALALIVALGVVFMPIAVIPQDSWDELTDTFLKVAVIFVLMVNLIDTPRRLRTILIIVTLCGTGLAAGAIVTYARGDFTALADGVGVRIEGVVEGIFGNPNDLATALNLLVPIAVALAVLSRGWRRPLFAAAAVVLAAGVIVTFSRSGFLGFVVMAGFLLFKQAPRKPVTTALAAVALAAVLFVAAPGGYGDRLASIFDASADETGSSSERLELLKRAVVVASRHVVLGVGMGNYHVYSLNEMRAHNSYLEISAELGVAGLAAYLLLIFWPIRGLRRVERGVRGDVNGAPREALGRELHVLSVALQAAFLAYVVCSLFASIQYLWYLYYLVAYAVATRRIYAANFAPAPAEAGRRLGALWVGRTRTGLGRLWPKPAEGPAQ